MRDLNVGSKFQLIEPLVVVQTNWRGDKTTVTYQSGLVISLYHYSIMSSGKRIKFKILKAKPVVKRYYGDIPEEVYNPAAKHISNKFYFTSFWNQLSLFGDNCNIFFDGLANGNIVHFDEEYEALNSRQAS
jgi:hypothetical protein